MKTPVVPAVLTVKSPAFKDNGIIPAQYTCQGKNINPSIEIENIPELTKSLALIMDDPDAPGRTFDHWIVWNIPPTGMIPENSVPGIEGVNHYNIRHYKGPCPPSGTHRYFFKLYALDRLLDLKAGADKKAVEKALEGNILAYGELIGRYSKS